MNWQIRQNITIQWLYKPKMAIKFLEWRTSARVTKILEKLKLNTSVLKRSSVTRDSVYIIWTKIDNFQYEKSKHLYRYITYIYFCYTFNFYLLRPFLFGAPNSLSIGLYYITITPVLITPLPSFAMFCPFLSKRRLLTNSLFRSIFPMNEKITQ